MESEYKVNSGKIRKWKKLEKKGIIDLFKDKRKSRDQDREELIQEIYDKIGQMKVDLDWLQKRAGLKL